MRRVEMDEDNPGIEAPPQAGLRARLSAIDPELRPRIIAIALALGLELLLILALISLGEVKRQVAAMTDALTTFDVSDVAEPAPEPESPPEPKAQPVPAQPAIAVPQPADVAEQPRRPLPPVPLPPKPAAVLRNSFDLGAVKGEQAAKPAAQPAVGPAYTPRPGDTPLIAGSRAPNGDPLYAARWYREPYDDELAGYLSTAAGPGWGLIDCRTARDWRVEDCVVIAESPEGSGIAKAVQGAAWQFKVRPPVKGGRSMVGEWVRIRIDYGIRPRG